MENKQKICKADKTQLKNIAEITQQYNQTLKRSVWTKKSDQPQKIDTVKQDQQVGYLFLQKYINCFRYLLSVCFRKQKKFEFDVNQSEMTKQVQKIKKKKFKSDPLLPPCQSEGVKTLVLDLDETLIHTSFRKPKVYDFTVEIAVNGQLQKLYVTKRFGLDIFLFEMSQLYDIVIFTAGLKEYTDKIMDNIDAKKRIRHVLYRQQCTVINKSYYLKNLKLLGRDLKQTILIDDNSMAGILHPQIFYKIEPFYGDQRDKKLLRLIQFLKMMALEDNFQCLIQRRKSFQAKNKRPKSFLNHNINLVKKQQIRMPVRKIKISQNSTLNKVNQAQQQTGTQLVAHQM